MKVEHIEAFRIPLSDGVDAVFVQVGEPWNGMLELRCVAPGMVRDDKIIVARSPSTLANGFDIVFGKRVYGDILLASPGIAAMLKAIKSAEAA